ncbi:MAG: fibronectin type III domain-containing protein, partial [Candidatus Nanopelagicales bacterium]
MTEFAMVGTRRGLTGFLVLATTIAVLLSGCGGSTNSAAGSSASEVVAVVKGGSAKGLSKSAALPACADAAVKATIASADAVGPTPIATASESSTSGQVPNASTTPVAPATGSASPPVSASPSVSASASASASSRALCPAVPSGLQAAPGTSKIAVSWTAPDPASPTVTSYLITLRPGERVVQVAAGRNGTTIPDLDNGIEYSVTIQAVNEVGASESSQPVLAT